MYIFWICILCVYYGFTYHAIMDVHLCICTMYTHVICILYMTLNMTLREMMCEPTERAQKTYVERYEIYPMDPFGDETRPWEMHYQCKKIGIQ